MTPSSGVAGFNANEDRRHDRRTIGIDELAKLIEAAHNGPDYRRMTGPARALCYRLAVVTGLRYAEIASTTPASFALGERPTVTVAAGYTKNGQTATLPLPRDLADDLAPLSRLDRRRGPRRSPYPAGGPTCSSSTWKRPASPTATTSGLVFDFHSLFGANWRPSRIKSASPLASCKR